MVSDLTNLKGEQVNSYPSQLIPKLEHQAGQVPSMHYYLILVIFLHKFATNATASVNTNVEESGKNFEAKENTKTIAILSCTNLQQFFAIFLRFVFTKN